MFPPTLTAEKRKIVSKLLLHIKEPVFSASLTSWMIFQGLRQQQAKSFPDKKLLSAASSWGRNSQFCGGNSYCSLRPKFQLLCLTPSFCLPLSTQVASQNTNREQHLWVSPARPLPTFSLEETVLTATCSRKQYKVITDE